MGKEIVEDTQSIFEGVGEDTKTVFEGGEVATEYTLYKKEEGLDITGNYNIVEQGVIVKMRDEDNISVKSFTVKEDGDNVSLKSVSFNNAEAKDEDNDDNDSVKTLTEEETNDISEEVTENNIDADTSSQIGVEDGGFP